MLSDGAKRRQVAVPAAELAKLAEAVPRAKQRFGMPASARVVRCYEAGRDGQQVYQAGCIACHDAGIAGAPKLGDKGQWDKRIAKGLDTLYASAVNGVQGSAGAMPAKGGNPTLSNAEVKAAVDYIVAHSK